MPEPTAPEALDAFRVYARSWLREHVPLRTANPKEELVRALTPDDESVKVAGGRAYQAALFDAGLAVITWPRQYGGGGLTPAHQEVFNDEASSFDLPTTLFVVPLGVCAPTLLQCGTEEQRLRHLPRMLRADELWCQLYSEPDAGSDLASLKTSAVWDARVWRITGQKVWTSGAHYSDFGLLIARTDHGPSRHHGLSVFVVPMGTPGVSVRPLRQMTGDAEFNEVFLDDVVVASDALVGELNEGWRVVTSSLSHERSAIGAGGPARPASAPSWMLLADLAREAGTASDARTRALIADVHSRERIIDMTSLRVRAASGHRVPGPEGSIGKLATADLVKRASSAALSIRGASAMAWADDGGGVWAKAATMAPAFGIAGGTTEIQKNVLAERILGLPR